VNASTRAAAQRSSYRHAASCPVRSVILTMRPLSSVCNARRVGKKGSNGGLWRVG
jgi:hypothetical protein